MEPLRGSGSAAARWALAPAGVLAGAGAWLLMAGLRSGIGGGDAGAISAGYEEAGTRFVMRQPYSLIVTTGRCSWLPACEFRMPGVIWRATSSFVRLARIRAARQGAPAIACR